MQYDYSSSDNTIMNISRYSIDPIDYNNYIKHYRLYYPDSNENDIIYDSKDKIY